MQVCCSELKVLEAHKEFDNNKTTNNVSFNSYPDHPPPGHPGGQQNFVHKCPGAGKKLTVKCPGAGKKLTVKCPGADNFAFNLTIEILKL